MSVLSPTIVQSPVSFSLNSPSPSRPFPDSPRQGHEPSTRGFLVPTDRTVEELEEKWLPHLGRLRVEREVTLNGYALYALRNWYLSRTHWTQTIVTQTGKPNEHVSCYVLVPEHDLSEQAGRAEIANAIQTLQSETHAQQRKTDYGTLLITTPSAFGQDVFPIPGGDLREMKPFLIVNTGLRRLGCGGRAAMGMESPIAAVRRRFLELYRLPTPPNVPLSPTASPSKSDPASPMNNNNNPQLSPHAILADPFTHILLEVVKLIQSALALWGMIGAHTDIDGLFCDETKAGVSAWRRSMGMEREESMRLEKEISGSCIDPKTLTALLSSITSTRYQLDALGVEKVPKDPLSSPRRFLQAWHSYQASVGGHAEYLTVSSIRQLNSQYLDERSRSPDALKVHKFLLSGVAAATSSIHAGLKGGAHEDNPLRKKEHHLLRNRLEDPSTESGFGLVIPAGEVGSYAPPDIMTSDLEAYTKGILKSREREWDVMGARRIAALWSGQSELRYKHSFRRLNGSVLRRRQVSIDESAEDGTHKGAFERISNKTGQAIRGGLGLVSRKNTYETSDSETGGPGPGTLRNALTKRKQSTVPTVVEPDVEEVDEQLLDGNIGISPSPAASRLHIDRPYGTNASRHSFLSATSHGRPSIITNVSQASHDSDARSRRSLEAVSPSDERTEEILGGNRISSVEERALAWRSRGRATTMLRTSSDGADVAIEEGGMEWEVINPHGTGKGRAVDERPIVRRHSLQDRLAYKSMRLAAAEHLSIDVELCSVIHELRYRERQLAQKARDTKILEESIFKASQDIIDALKARRTKTTSLQHEAEGVEKDLRKLVDEIEDDEAVQWASKKIQFYLSEDTHTNEIMWSLRHLEKEWEEVRQRAAEEEKGENAKKGRWWWFW